MSFCRNCGSMIDPVEKYCEQCGMAAFEGLQACQSDIDEDEPISEIKEGNIGVKWMGREK